MLFVSKKNTPFVFELWFGKVGRLGMVRGTAFVSRAGKFGKVRKLGL